MNIDLSFIQFSGNINKEFMQICESHPGCEGCPLKTEDKEIKGTKLRCNTGRGDIR
jgi:hypothetical protein